MIKNRAAVIGAVGIVYFIVATYGLYIFDAGLVISALVLFALPSFVLARFSSAPTVLLLTVAVLGLGIGALFEATAHLYGLWYTTGAESLRLFGLIPIEALWAAASQALFLALLYEIICDDGVYTERSAQARFGVFVVFFGGLLGLIALHQYLAQGLFIAYAYMWLIGAVFAVSISALAVYRVYSVSFIDRLFNFSIIGAFPLFCALLLSVTNGHRVFPDTFDYAGMISLFGVNFPIEELLVVFLIPFIVASAYELYLDDRT